MKRKFILLTLVIATLIVPANLQAFESTVEEELQTPWEGFGYNQWGFARESDGNTFKPWSDDLWKTTTERILAIKPSLVRLPVIRDWFNKDDDGNNLPIGTYNWDSKYMQAYFKIMDLYKEHDIKVMSGFWGVGYNGEDYKQFYTTDECAQLQADLIEYLFSTKGYDKIITSYAPSNEPLGVGISYEDWSTMIKKLYTELEKRGLPTNFLSGADSWSDWIWKPAQYNADQLSAYDFHNYLNDTPDDTYNQLYNRTIETTFANYLANVYKYDNFNKPVHVSEMAPIGVPFIDWPVADAPAHCRIDTYEYALGFWDYGIQLARSGMASGLAWAIDGLEQNKNAGMWNNAGTYGGMTLRPWYYTWQLMCRYFPRGAKILKMTELEGRKDIRILGARIGSEDYSFVAVNRRMDAQSKTQSITFKVDCTKPLYIYRFNRNSCGDGAALSLPYEKITDQNLSTGITVEVPMEEGIFITTLEPLETNTSETQSTLTIDFESQDGYMLLGDYNKGIRTYVGSNPRKRDPNTSDNAGYSEILINDEYNPRDCFSTIFPLNKILISEDFPLLNIQLYRSRPAKIAIALHIQNEDRLLGYEFEIPHREWEELQLNLTPLIGKTLDYIIIYPYRDSATTSTLDTESLIFDNIFLSNTENSPIDLQEITTNNDQQYRQILDIDFEYLNSFVKVIPANSSIMSSIASNPKIQENNPSDKACQINILTNDAGQDLSAQLNLYPFVQVPESNHNLLFSYYRPTGQSEIKIVVNFLSGEKAVGHFSCYEKREWFRYGLNLSNHVGQIITSIDIYPNLNYSDRLNVLDTSFFDNFIFSTEEVSGIEYITNNDISVTAENGYIYIEGVKNMPVYLFSVDGKLLHFAENVNGSYSIPAENGVHLIKIGNTSYKIINF